MDYVNEARRGFISLDKLFVWGSDARAAGPSHCESLNYSPQTRAQQNNNRSLSSSLSLPHGPHRGGLGGMSGNIGPRKLVCAHIPLLAALLDDGRRPVCFLSIPLSP